jgi:hypothetical protein
VLWLLSRFLLLPVKTATGSMKLGYRTGRLVGYRRLFVFGAGVAVGLLLAPRPGRELRERLRQLAESRRPPTDVELADRVRFELKHAPRTWHLPQPDVAVASGRVVLTGEAPHETGRADLERAAAAVAGVVDVDNLVVVTGTNGSR